MKLIGLIGRARVGKDTVAEHLCSYHGFSQYAFADPMKDMLEAVFGDRFRGGDREVPIDWLGKSPRHLMQTLGTEWGRNCVHPELWTLLAERVVEECTKLNYNLVISDVRFHNEADMILRHGGELWHIERDGATVAEHISECTQWDGYDRIKLFNNTTLARLYTLVDTLIEQPEVTCARSSNPALPSAYCCSSP